MDGARDVEVVADSDSRWKWGAAVAPLVVGERPTRVHGTLLLGRSEPNEQQLEDVGAVADTLRRATLAETVARLARTDADVVVLACVGDCAHSLLHALSRAWEGRTSRPVVVTGYVGLVYERVVDGLLGRAGADVVLANSPADAERFRQVYAALGIGTEAIVTAALPFLGGAPHDPAAAGRERPFTVTFAAQPGVPESRADRRYAVQQAAEHARRRPERHVLVKLRGRPGERTTHVEPYHYAKLLPPDERPANLELIYGPMPRVLDRTDLLVTVSSTAAVEAMHRGIPTAILTDFGIRETLGNQLFLGSGAFLSWPELHAGVLPGLDDDWAKANGVTPIEDPYADAVARVTELAARGELPPLRPWLGPETAGAYVPAVLARYGVAPDGRPTAAPPPTGRSARALRTAARRAYGLGVRVLEPRMKRWAQL